MRGSTAWRAKFTSSSVSLHNITVVIDMSDFRKTAIVTGASQGIGAGLVRTFVKRGYNVVANSRKMTRSTEVTAGTSSLWWMAT